MFSKPQRNEDETHKEKHFKHKIFDKVVYRPEIHHHLTPPFQIFIIISRTILIPPIMVIFLNWDLK